MRTAMVGLCALTAMTVAALAQSGWKTYANPRFGVSVEYPSVFSQPERPPDNGDGQAFRTAAGDARLTVYGAYNANNQSAAELMATYRTAGVNYTYAQATKTWFVLSGKRESAIDYMRCSLGRNDVVGCFDIEYPAADAAKWAPIVERLGKSLRISPGGAN